MNASRWIAALLCLAAGSASAETLLINDGTLHTMGSQGIVQRGDVLLRDGRVKAVGRDLPVPADAVVIEAGGRPVTPGFFAGLSQVGLVEISLEAPSVDGVLASEVPRPEFDVSTAFNPDSSVVPVTRIEGYSWAMLSPGRGGSIFAGQGRPVSLSGRYEAFLGEQALFLDIGGDASEQSAGSRASQWMLLDQAFEEAAAGPQWVPSPLLTMAGRRTMSQYADGGLVVFDVDRASDILKVVEFSARHDLRPVVHGGAEAWKVAERLAEAGVPVLLNPLQNLPGNFDRIGARLDNASLLHAAGVMVGFSTGETHNARTLRQAAGNAVAHGLPYEAGLAGLTSVPAAVFELEPGSGLLAVDGPADVVIWSGDPLEVTTVAEVVVINGERVEMVSRQTLLRDRYLAPKSALPRAYPQQR